MIQEFYSKRHKAPFFLDTETKRSYWSIRELMDDKSRQNNPVTEKPIDEPASARTIPDDQRLRDILHTLQAADITPRPHQHDGIRWMCRQEAAGQGGLLADDPGLGKTYQALSLICGDTTQKTIIIVPTSIIGQWEEAAVRLFGRRSVCVHHGNRSRTLEHAPRITISTYGLLRKDKAISEVAWDRIILDEIHAIKTRSSKTSKAAMELRGRFRWGLSGTPVQNKLDETANLFRFILGLPVKSRDRLDVPTLISTHMLRRQKEIVLAEELPDLHIRTQPVTFVTDQESQFYHRVMTNVAKEYAKVLGSEAKVENMVMFELLLRMRQASQHPQLVLNGFRRKYKKDFGKWTERSSKHTALLRLLKTHPDGDSLVFCQFTEEIRILAPLLREEGYDVLRLDGSMSAMERSINLDAGKNTRDPSDTSQKPRVFLIQIVAGGVGLNLQAFSHVYLMSPDWNPCNEIQAIARAHRMGQLKDVNVTRLVLESEEEGGPALIDARILDIQSKKRNLMATLLSEERLRNNGKVRTRIRLSARDFQKLLGGRSKTSST